MLVIHSTKGRATNSQRSAICASTNTSLDCSSSCNMLIPFPGTVPLSCLLHRRAFLSGVVKPESWASGLSPAAQELRLDLWGTALVRACKNSGVRKEDLLYSTRSVRITAKSHLFGHCRGRLEEWLESRWLVWRLMTFLLEKILEMCWARW